MLKIEDENEVHETTEFVPDASISQVLGAGFDKGMELTSIMSIGKKMALTEAQEVGPMLPMDEISNRFGIEADRDMTAREAQLIKDTKIDNDRRDMLLEHSPNTLFGKAASMLSPIAGAVADPVDVAIGLALSAVTAPAVAASQIGRLGKFGVAVAENAGSMALTELAAKDVSNEFLEEYTATEAFTNVVIGSVALTGVIHGSGAIFSKIFKNSPQHAQSIISHVDNLVSEGKTVDEAMTIIKKVNEKDLKLTDDAINSIMEVFPDVKHVDIVMDGADDLLDIFSNIKNAVNDGKITEEVAEQFMKSLETTGKVPKRVLNRMNPQEQVEYSKEAIKELQDSAKDPKNDMGYNERGEEIRTKDEDYSQEAMDAENDKWSDEVAEAREKKADMDEMDLEMKKAHDADAKKVKKATEEKQVIEQIAACGRLK